MYICEVKNKSVHTKIYSKFVVIVHYSYIIRVVSDETKKDLLVNFSRIYRTFQRFSYFRFIKLNTVCLLVPNRARIPRLRFCCTE